MKKLLTNFLHWLWLPIQNKIDRDFEDQPPF